MGSIGRFKRHLDASKQNQIGRRRVERAKYADNKDAPKERLPLWLSQQMRKAQEFTRRALGRGR